MKKELFYGDAGVRRNPRVGDPVRFRQAPDVLGRVVEEKTDVTGGQIFRVEWIGALPSSSWHPAEGLLVAEDIS